MPSQLRTLSRNSSLRTIVCAVSMLFGLPGCSPNSSSGSLGSDGSNEGATVDQSGDCKGNSLIEGGSSSGTNAGQGTITFRLASNTDPCSVDGYVVGAEGSSGVTRNSDGTYTISGATEGEQDIIVTGTSGSGTNSDGAAKPNDVGGSNLQQITTNSGIRINSVQSNIPTQTIRLSAFGTMSGVVKLSGVNDHTGIDVYIPGTSYTAKTDAGGNYRLESLPAARAC